MKRFIIDSCVAIDDPECWFKLGDNEIIIPFKVLEELDHLKDGNASKNEGARSAIRNIYALSQEGKLSKGVKLDNGAFFRVDVTDPREVKLPFDLDVSIPDNNILAIAYHNKKKTPKTGTILITNDINLRIKAECLDIQTEKYENRSVKKAENLFSPYAKIEITEDHLDQFIKTGHMGCPKDVSLYPNQFVLLRAFGSKQSGLARYDAERSRIEALRLTDQEACGIKPRNLEQRFAMSGLMDDNIKLFSLIGRSGTGKTLLAVAAAISKLQSNTYKRILIARPTVPLSKSSELGFLPGDLSEKLAPWGLPIMDSLDTIMDSGDGSEARSLVDRGIIEFTALSVIRGRSLENCILIVDEFQNCLPREAKAILTRLGEKSKAIILGDPYQIDIPYADQSSCALSYVVEKFKNQSIAGHSVLTKCERSSLSALAADLL